MDKDKNTSKNVNIYSCEKCLFECNKKNDWDRHIVRPKHLRMLENSEKNANLFSCKKCDFKCSKQSDWVRHIVRPKHLIMLENDETPKNTVHICKKCSRSYQYSSGLWKHSKTCNVIKKNEIINSSTNHNDNTLTNKLPNDKSIIELLIKENSEFKNIVFEMVKSNSELQKQMIEVCKNSSNINTNINSNNHSNNKTFNLQFFLNEQCKDAMNISDFANSFDLQLSDLESVGELGYVEGISKIIVDKLNGMDIYKRPMHCSDAKREIIYVKDENVWTKEEKNNPKLRQAIKHISFRNMKLVYNWSNTYPESKDNETRLNDKYIKLVLESSGGSGLILDSENKIIRRIVKEIIIGKA